MTGRRVEIAFLGLFAAFAAVIRLPALRALPIFGDEATYLRLARIVRAAPLEHLWVSLKIPIAPLHVWLVALVLPISADPVFAGRLVSVLLGVALAAAVAGSVRGLGPVFGARDAEPLLSAALAAASPFLVFSDRLARPDTLFALETVLAAWLSLSMASRARPLRPAIAFGILMGVTMLTRQAVSYPLWLLPPIAFVCAGRRDWRRLLGPLGLALAIALVLWTPMLVVPAWPDFAARVFHLGTTRPTLPILERAALFARNLATAVAAFWVYLTPPVFLASAAGFVLLAARRRRLFAFLASWELLLLLPAAVFAIDYFPRYALPAAIPLLVAAGFAIALAWARAGRAIRIALVAALFTWPLADAARGVADWSRWRLLPVDRRQYLTGWSAGLASERAASFLEERARASPIAVIVSHVSGNPSDAVWLLLEDNPRIRLFYADDFLHQPALRVKGDVWIDAPGGTVPPDRPVDFVSQDPAFLGREGWAPASGIVLPLNPGARPVARFENPPNEKGLVESAIEIFRLR